MSRAFSEGRPDRRYGSASTPLGVGADDRDRRASGDGADSQRPVTYLAAGDGRVPGRRREVVLEATYGWYWAADALAELGATVHLAHPLGVKAFSYRRVKNDQPRRHRGRSPNARSGVARAEWTTRSARRSHPRQSSRCARVGRPSTLRSKISVCKFPSDNIRTHRSTHRAVADSRKMS